MKTRLLMITGILGLALVGALFFIFHPPDALVGPGDDKKAKAPSRLPVKGCMQSYRMHTRTVTKMQLPGAVSRTALDIEGKLNFRVFDITDEKAQIGVMLSPAVVKSNGSRDKRLEDFYGTYFLATMDAEGRFSNFQFPDRIADEDKSLLEGMLLTFEMLLPLSPEVPRIKTAQKDATGKYSALYEYTENANSKQKLDYITLKTDAAGFGFGDVDAAVVQSETFFKPAPDGNWLEQLNGNERLAFKSSDGRPLFTIRLAFGLERTPARDTEMPSEWTASDTVKETLQGFKQHPGPEKTLAEIVQQDSAAGVSTTEFSTLSEAVFQLGDGNDYAASVAFRKYLLRHPAEIHILPDKIRAAAYDDDQTAEIINVLGIIGIPSAQAALTTIINDPGQSEMNRFRAVLSLGSLNDSPTEQTIKTLEAMADRIGENDLIPVDIKTTAALTLGIISKNMAASFPEIAGQINQNLITTLENSATPIKQDFMLSALGNSRRNAAVPYILPFLAHPDHDLRQSAAEALGNMTDPDSMRALSFRMPVEKNPDTRIAIVKGLENRSASLPESVIDMLNRQLRHDQNPDVRRHLISLLAMNINRHPETRSVLADQLTVETSKVNARMLIKALY